MTNYNYLTDTATFHAVTEDRPIHVSTPDYARVCPCCKLLTKERFIKKVTGNGLCIRCANGKHSDSCEVTKR